MLNNYTYEYYTYECSGESVHGERFQVDRASITRIQFTANIIPDREKLKQSIQRKFSQCPYIHTHTSVFKRGVVASC